MMNEPVQSIMSTNLITLKPDSSLEEAKTIFMNTRIHHIPVLDGKKIVGLVTTFDLWKLDIPFEEYHLVKLKQIMSTQLAKIEPTDKIGTAAELFLDNRLHALPVVDDDNHLVGLVTSFDVLMYEFKKEYPRPILYSHLYGIQNRSILQRGQS